MRFVLAIVSFVVAALLIGLGFAQRTVLAQPDRVVAQVVAEADAPVTVIDGGALNAYAGSQTVTISGSDTIVAAYGRTIDINAWVGDTTRTVIGFDVENATLTSELIEGEEDALPDPSGSDLWYGDYSGEGELGMRLNVPTDVSILLVADGVEPAPASVRISWPVDNSTPWAVPLVIGGGVFLIIGLGLLLWAIARMRKSRGPRRKSQKMPKLPKPPRYKPAKPRAIAGDPKGRRSSRTRFVAILPVAIIGSLALGGCSAGFWSGTQAPLVATPTPTAEVLDDGSEVTAADEPAVTVNQAKRIISRIADVAAQADETSDPALLSTRLAGPALQQRTANYTMRAADPAIPAIPPIPSGPVELTLPVQNEDWPRTVFAVIQDDADETIPPVALMLIQDDARSQYKVHYTFSLEPGVTIPDVAPASVGAARYLPDYKLLVLPPEQIAPAYGDILAVDTESASYDLFEAEGDSFRVSVGVPWKNERIAGIPPTATVAFEGAIGDGQVISLATYDTGAIVAVNWTETETVKPVEAGAAVNTTTQIKALTGLPQSTKGFQAVYGEQLLFYVPSVTTGGKIVLLGATTNIISGSELP